MTIQIETIANFLSWENLERHFKVVVFVLTTVSVILCITIVILTAKPNEVVQITTLIDNNVCLKPGCVEMASKLINNMDLKVDPCIDFYSFACGNFMKHTPIPADEFIVGSFQDAQKKVLGQLKNLLEERSTSKELLPFKQTKRFYNSCMNTRAIELDGLETIKIVLQSLNGWPIIEGGRWYDAKFDWKQAMYVLRNLGFSVDYFIKLDVTVDLHNSSLRVISLDQANFGINRRNLINGFNDSVTQSYYRYMVDVAEIFGANRSKALEELRQSLNLEIELAKISLSPSQREEEKLIYNPVTVLKLQNEYPNSNWKKYIKYVLDIPGFQISDDDIVILRIPRYLNDLEDLIENTSKRVQANYIMWRVLFSTTKYLNEKLRKRRLVFYKEVYGEQQSAPLWKECVSDTMLNFWESLSNMYMRKHSHKQTKRVLNTMFTKIGANFVKLIEKSKWMDNETKRYAYDKATGMPYYTTHSDEMDNETLLNFYSPLQFTTDNYLRSVMDVWLFRSNNHFKKLCQTVTKEDRQWDVSLVYQMGVPQGLFQGSFFNKDRPHYANYGAVGSIIGHLLTHIFDNHGRQFDKDLELIDWWTNYTKEAYQNVTQCVVRQYDNYTIKEVDMKLNGKRTLTENVADITGLKVAYLAYNNWAKNHPSEALLPGLNYTQNQMFWISAASMWCTKYREEYLRYMVLIYPFSPANFRVTGSLNNLVQFSKDFNCSATSAMNKRKKCVVW
ncbi:hypothetical protein RI129_005474 [Pyrocoelia pectoralis]|uniref:Uncharacterized protein n=1 Tax=Pyrocoelia pectoralis TaxID=417401 RepID=A0AAN7VEV7_9COLE